MAVNPFLDRFAYIANPHNIDPSVMGPRMKAAGVKTLAVVINEGELSHSEDDWQSGQNVDQFRQQGFRISPWIVTDFWTDIDDAALLVDRWFDMFPYAEGLVVDAEASFPVTPQFLAALHYRGPMCWSVIPTMEAGGILKQLAKLDVVLSQQAYKQENGISPQAAVHWIVNPPIYVGWSYYIAMYRPMVGTSQGHRVEYTWGKVIANAPPGTPGWMIKEGSNTWRLDPTTKTAIKNKSGKVVGNFVGAYPYRLLNPSVRITPVNGVNPDPREHKFDLIEAAKIAGHRSNPMEGGLYLAEGQTDAAYWQRWQ